MARNVELILPPLHPKQKILADFRKEKYTVICAGSKFGKTLGESIKIAHLLFMADTPIQVLWGAPYYSNAKVAFKYMKRLIHPDLRDDNKSDLVINFKHNGAMIAYKGLNHDPEAAEGEAYHHVVLDEVSKMKADCLPSVRTTTTQTKANIDLISTPRGRNHFHDAFLKGMDPNNPDYISFTFPTSDNPNVDPKEIEIARRELSAAHFQQYFLAQFVDNSEIFTGYQQCIMDQDPLVFRSKEKQMWVSPDCAEKNVVIGVDWAKAQDYSVFIAVAYEETRPRVVGFARFRHLRYTEAVALLGAFSRRFLDTTIVFHDKTGVGQALDDLMVSTRLAHEGKTFTNRLKAAWVNDLTIAIEQQKIWLPNWQEMRTEFEGFEVTVTAAGSYKYEASTGHDDIICALLLAWQATLEFATIDLEVKELEQLGQIEETAPELPEVDLGEFGLIDW